LKNASLYDTFVHVQTEQTRRHCTDGRKWLYRSALQPEMIFPSIRSRIEEAHHHAGGIHRTDIRTLESITDHAGVREIVHYRLPTVLPTDDVVNFVSQGGVFLMNLAVLVSPTSAPRHVGAQVRANLQERSAKMSRAFAFAMRRMCSSSRKRFNSAASSGVSAD
jgi:hypothetical protein